MVIKVDGFKVKFPNKLEPRKDEIIRFARENAPKRANRRIHIWETKRHELAALVVKG